MKSNGYDLNHYKSLARQTVAEGCVLLENRNHALPLRKGEKLAVFGRCAHYYYKSGLGSGGLVNTEYVVSILDALKESDDVVLHDGVMRVYEEWIQEHPVDEGNGWGTVPWSQEEMPISDNLMKIAKDADTALVFIGRTAGEDQDNSAREGSFFLTKTENAMIEAVCESFVRSIVILNVGNIIDMSWVERYQPAAVLYVWQGGQEGGNGVADVLLGRVSPSGKLMDTIAKEFSDYPSNSYYGNEERNEYTEDIYVGYRYFESFAREKVLYPFGFGLSYTEFSLLDTKLEIEQDSFTVYVTVKNMGEKSGKEVVQIYLSAPQGKLGKPDKVLVGFVKTKELAPKESKTFTVNVPFSYFAAFDDTGVTGHSYCWILEAGTYEVYVGNSVRNVTSVAAFDMSERVMEQLGETCAPEQDFKRWKRIINQQGDSEIVLEVVKAGSQKEQFDEKEQTLPDIPFVGNQGYLLADVAEQKITMDSFLSQLSDKDLIMLFYGEGMCSEKVTPGTAGAFGGVTKQLAEYGIPVACCADGPSGIRMDCGTKAFSLPNGTLIGCTFNEALAEELYEMLGAELVKNKVDTILGPGINIHRHLFNGRNFEYFSEDPLLTGRLCAAQLRGLHKQNVTGTIKHFCANNQEYKRCEVDSAVSMRALREIYLRTFEIAVKEGNARAIMTAYNPVNGIWAAGNKDLCTTVLRKDWGYTGIVMTDWWATANWKSEKATKDNRAPMIIAQNDIYMCCSDANSEIDKDNIFTSLEKGIVTRGELLRNAKNILGFLITSKAMERLLSGEANQQITEEESSQKQAETTFYVFDEAHKVIEIQEDKTRLDEEEIQFGIRVEHDGDYMLNLSVESPLGELAQIPVSIYVNRIFRCMVTFQGTNGRREEKQIICKHLVGKNHYITIKKQSKGLDIVGISMNAC